MSQIKLAAVSTMLSLAFVCSIAAQELDPNCQTTASASRHKQQLFFAVPPGDVYGTYVPYNGPLLNPQEDDSVPSKSCVTPSEPKVTPNASPRIVPPPKPEPKTEPPKEDVYGSYVPYVPPAKADPSPTEVAANVPPNCGIPAAQTTPNSASQQPVASLVKPEPQKEEVYGPYIPYVPPIQKTPAAQVEVASVAPTACITPNASAGNNPPQPTLSAAQGGSPEAPAPTSAIEPPPASLATGPSTIDPSPTAVPVSTSEFVRLAPAPPKAKEPPPIRPFRTFALGFKADTLGAGAEIATPLARNFNLRSSFNLFAFNDPFSIDGLNYNARLHLQSSETSVDWFPLHTSFHVSPGILYVKNNLSATTSVDPGRSFTLGSQPFINSVDDPVYGSASVIFPHKIAPMLLFGFGNIIPRSGRHLSIPIEFGAAYTGAAQISVNLAGTACTTQGCANFATNVQAQTYLKQEVHDLNEDLKKFPVFPIVSLGLAYHF